MLPDTERDEFEIRFVWSNEDRKVFAAFIVCPIDDEVVKCSVSRFVEFRSQDGNKIADIGDLPLDVRLQVERLIGSTVSIQDGARFGGIIYIETP